MTDSLLPAVAAAKRKETAMKKLLCLILALVLFLALASCQAQAASDGGGMDEDHLFKPLQWFGDLPDGSELVDWDIYDDENATGLLLYFYTDPQVGVDLFEAYTDQLDSCGDVLRVSKEDFDSGFSGSDNDTDRESLYRYLSRKVGAVTAMRSGKYCDFAVHQLWLDEDVLVVALAWGEDFPIEVDPDDLVALDIGELPDVSDAQPNVSDEGPASDPSDPAAGGGNVTYDAYSTYLPSPDAWFDGQLARGEDMEAYGGLLVSYYMDLEDLPAIEAYVQLLAEDSRFQLKEVESREADYTEYTGQIFYRSFFDYTGSASTGTVNYADDYGPCAVVVAYSEDFVRGACGMTVCYANEFTFVDDGDRWGGDVTDLSGGASSGGGLDLSDGGTDYSPPCSMCDGSGRCDNCDGSGYTYDYVTGRNDKICSDCNGTGRCRWCHGTGHT